MWFRFRVFFTNVLLLICVSFHSVAQLQVTSGIAPAQLVQNILLGSGVSATNITFSGDPGQIGQFDGQNASIGIQNGVILSSGNVVDANQISPSTAFGGPGDPDLLTVAQSVTTNPDASFITDTHDAAILEFDFVPQGDTVSFNFVFASEEYLAFVNSQFNDAFGFFLSGPGITGPYAAPVGFPGGAVNLAAVPGQALPITISTIYPPSDYDFDGNIDPGFNDQYYINNPNDSTHGFNGFTSVLNIVFQVICGETYHFKFAVADCQDGTLDTGVFLEAGSFESQGSVSLSISTDTGTPLMIEGCSGASLKFTRPENQSADSLVINYTLQGTAVNGTDYSGIPSEIVFVPGQDTLILQLTAADDGLSEGMEYVVLEVNVDTQCGSNQYTDTLQIVDKPVISVTTAGTQGCTPLTVNFNNSSQNGNNYFWDFGDGNFQTVATTGNMSHTFSTSSTTVLIASYNGFCPDSVHIPIVVHPNPIVSVNSGTICFGSGMQLNASGALNYSWNPPNGLSSQTGSSVYASPEVTTTYVVIGVDANMCSGTATALVTVEHVDVQVNSDSICASVATDAAILNASGAADYIWSPPAGLNSVTGATVSADPSVTTLYQVVGVSAIGCTDTAIALVTVVPDFVLEGFADTICPGETALMYATGADVYSWSPSEYLDNANGSPVNATPPSTMVYTLTGVLNTCPKSVDVTVLVRPKPQASISVNPQELTTTQTEAEFTANESGNQNTWYYNGAVISVLQHFKYEFPEIPGVYQVDLVAKNMYGCVDSTFKLIQVKEEIIFFVPNAFSPDGNSLNPLFIPVMTSGIDPKNYHLKIYNRWGETIYESSQIGEGWDGTYRNELCQQGLYTWVIKFGSKYTDDQYDYQGHVLLLR